MQVRNYFISMQVNMLRPEQNIHYLADSILDTFSREKKRILYFDQNFISFFLTALNHIGKLFLTRLSFLSKQNYITASPVQLFTKTAQNAAPYWWDGQIKSIALSIPFH